MAKKTAVKRAVKAPKKKAAVGTMSDAGRASIAAAQRKRWAAWRRANGLKPKRKAA